MTEKAPPLLRDVLPRLYAEAQREINARWPELAGQLDELRIEGRCDCGACSDFFVTSPLRDAWRDLSGATRPMVLYYDIQDSPVLLGVAGEGPCAVLVGFEMVGGDYADDYVHRQLEEAGFIRSEPGDGLT